MDSSKKSCKSFHKGKTISKEHKQAISEKLSGGNSPRAKQVVLVDSLTNDGLSYMTANIQINALNEPLNIAHSLDGYVMRTLIRHCSYDPKTIETKLKKVEAELAKRTEEESVYFGDITESNYKTMSTGQLIGQYLDLSDMLLYKPFDVITVHDNFGCHPKHMNRLRYWYNQIMSRMSTNKYLDNIVSQLVREDIEIDLPRASVAAEIQKANYAIC